MIRRSIKLRSYLLIANAASLAAVLGLLFYCYSRMLLDAAALAWLCGATVIAGLLSFALHFAMIRPLEEAIGRIGDASREMAAGSLDQSVPIVGPREFRLLAERFNDMSRQLSASFARMKRLEEARRELVAHVAHDLRTPLALLQSHAEALQDGVAEDEETVVRYAQTIRTETVRLGALVQDLFELSKLDAGAMPYTPEAVVLEDVLVETLNAYGPRLEAKRLDVSVSLPEPPPAVWGMPLALRRIMGNLLDNAIRHAPEGSALRWSAESAGGRAFIRLADEGEGVPEADRDRIFERFYRSDQSRSRDRGGAGLGLAIAKSLVGLHGGEIGVESGPDGGSVFWFTVPVAGRTRKRRG